MHESLNGLDAEAGRAMFIYNNDDVCVAAYLFNKNQLEEMKAVKNFYYDKFGFTHTVVILHEPGEIIKHVQS